MLCINFWYGECLKFWWADFPPMRSRVKTEYPRYINYIAQTPSGNLVTQTRPANAPILIVEVENKISEASMADPLTLSGSAQIDTHIPQGEAGVQLSLEGALISSLSSQSSDKA